MAPLETFLKNSRNLFGVLLTSGFLILSIEGSYAQCVFTSPNCQANMTNGTSINFNALTWTHNSGPACPVIGNTSYNGALLVTMGNNTNLTISSNFTVNADFNITNTGSNATLTIPAGVTLHVVGDLGDCTNNNVNFVVNGTLIVDGYVSGKNSNGFSGTGTVTATGGLYFNMAPTCTSCSIVWNVGSCVPASAFCTLPISLLYFKGAIENGESHLTWATETEKNNDYFSVEKSSDGVVFEEIAQIKGQGNSFRRIDYEFTDGSLMIGKSYYRLKQTDFDKQSAYFNTVAIDYGGAKTIQVFPIPVKDGILNIKLNFKSESESRITVTDVVGTILVDVTSSQQITALQLPVKSGIYLVRVVNGDFSVTRRFLVN